jgi:RNA polymerase sigma factor (sigma-70 family)
MRLRRDRLLDQLEQLYRDQQEHFVRVARAITGDPERAVEAVQDAFAGVIRSRRDFREDGSLEAWVWRAVVNAARKSCRRPLVEIVSEVAREPELAPATPELAPVISALPERQRLAIFLRYYADLDYRSIAEVLGVEVGTVSASLAAAHRSIRQSIQEVRADA